MIRAIPFKPDYYGRIGLNSNNIEIYNLKVKIYNLLKNQIQESKAHQLANLHMIHWEKIFL